MSGFRAALDYLSNFIRPRCAEREKRVRGKSVLIMDIGFLASFHAISPECSSFSKIATLFFKPLWHCEAVGIAHEPPRSP